MEKYNFTTTVCYKHADAKQRVFTFNCSTNLPELDDFLSNWEDEDLTRDAYEVSFYCTRGDNVIVSIVFNVCDFVELHSNVYWNVSRVARDLFLSI